MKKILLMASAVCCCIILSAQTGAPSPKVLGGFSAQQIAAMSPEQVDWYNFLADNMCLVNKNPQKSENLTDLNGLIDPGVAPAAVTNSAGFNPFLYNIEPEHSENQYFRVGNTGYTVFVYSHEKLEELYERFKINNGH